jgi:hypothetical protein
MGPFAAPRGGAGGFIGGGPGCGCWLFAVSTIFFFLLLLLLLLLVSNSSSALACIAHKGRCLFSDRVQITDTRNMKTLI